VKIVADSRFTALQFQPGKDVGNFFVSRVARHFVRKVAIKIVLIPVLKYFGRMKRNSVSELPKASLRNKTFPDVARPKGAVAWKV
jgi:hypothetical protein